MAGYRLLCFGSPGLELDGSPVKLEMRKALALLAYLRMTAHHCSRESLAALFWPEYDQNHAQANLRRTLASLNKSLRPGVLEADRERVGYREISCIWLDVGEFLDLLTSLKIHPHSQNETCPYCRTTLESAVQLYQGDFMEGFNLSDCPEFDEWQLLQRENLRQELSLALQKLASFYAAKAQWKPAISYARRWVGLDPLHEPSCRFLMDLYARSGQRTAAVRQYDILRRLLKEQLDQPPEPETQQLFEQLRRHQPETRASEFPARTVSFPLLKTKLYIPSPPTNRVNRSELVNRLAEVEHKALTLISAPAGFGKTTLLAEWIAQTSLPIAWLSLDVGDNDLYRFLSYLSTALENIDEDVSLQALQLIQSTQPVSPYIILASLINDLGKAAEPYVLAFDDYQFITETPVHETLSYLLDHLPANMHVLIASRADPPLQLGRLRAQNELLELRVQDLRFNFEETSEFLNTIMNLELSEQDIKALETRTEGWIAGLKMAALSLEGRKDPSEFIQAFSGSYRYVLDYLLEEVLKRQAPLIQSFLLETSVLGKLSGPLCDALMTDEWKKSGENGQSILEHLERNNLFLIPLDDERKWFRYHHLFADLLITRLKQHNSESVPTLHRKAANWYAEHDYPDEAVNHALAARDIPFAAELVEQYALSLIAHSEIATILGWIQSLPPELIRSRPRMMIYHAWVLARTGDLDHLEELLQEAESLIAASPQSSEELEMRNYLTQFRAYMANIQGDPDLAIRVALNGAKPSGPSTNLLTAVNFLIGFQLGYAYYSKGDLETAEKIYQSVAKSAEDAEDIYNTIITQVELAGIQLLRGNMSQAEQIYRSAMAWLVQKVQNPAPLDGILKVCLADVHLERNELQEASRLVREGIEDALLGFRTNTLAHGYTTLAHVMRAQGELHHARDAADRAILQIENHRTYPRTVKIVQTCQVNQWLAEGDLIAAQKWAREIFPTSCQPLQFTNELEHIALARVLLASQQYGEGLDLLKRLAESAEAGGRGGRLVSIYLLQALAFYGLGNIEGALQMLGKSLAVAQPQGYFRAFLDEGPQLKALIRKGSQTSMWQESKLNDYIKKLLSAFETADHWQSSTDPINQHHISSF